MSNITAQAVFTGKQGQEELLASILKELIAHSIEEDGCLQYEGYQDKKIPSVFVILEKWLDKEVFVKHSKQPHLAEAMNKMESLLAKPFSIAFYNEL
jgi:quinol monooxygenase YgiN